MKEDHKGLCIAEYFLAYLQLGRKTGRLSGSKSLSKRGELLLYLNGDPRFGPTSLRPRALTTAAERRAHAVERKATASRRPAKHLSFVSIRTLAIL